MTSQLRRPGPTFVPDDEAFRWYADPTFPWVHLIYGIAPKLPPRTWVYVLQADGRTSKRQSKAVRLRNGDSNTAACRAGDYSGTDITAYKVAK